MGWQLRATVQDPGNLKPPEPAALYTLLAATSCSVGELIDFAKSIPPFRVAPVAWALGRSLGPSDADRDQASRRRELVVLTTLVTRLTFEIAGVPQDPHAEI